jgi:hypothetical protein
MSMWHSPLIAKPPSRSDFNRGYFMQEYQTTRPWQWVLGGALGFIGLSFLFTLVLVISCIGRVGQWIKDKSLSTLTRALIRVLSSIPEKELETIRESLSQRTSSQPYGWDGTSQQSLSSAQLHHMGKPFSYPDTDESPTGSTQTKLDAEAQQRDINSYRY